MPCIRRTPKEHEEAELRLQQALAALCSGKYKTAGKAARFHGVHASTLRDRWMGKRRDNKTAHISQHLLTDAQREALVSWCIHLSLLAQPLDRVTIGQYVHALCGKYPSGSWVDRFLREHRDLLVLRSASGIDPKRAQAFNESTVNRHFELLKSVVYENDIPPENVHNMDEKGGQMGGGRKNNGRKFICGRTQRNSLKLRDPNLELATVVECVSADGTSLEPGFILTGAQGNFHEQWFEEKGIGSIALSPNGWTDDELTYLWFVKVFVPQAMAKNKSRKPILLIMDGHGSHCTDQMQEYGYACNPRVHIFLLPPHTTHRLQPLDVGVFGVAQRRWSRLCDQRAMEGNLITRDTFVSEWMKLRTAFMREDIIKSSFEKTGIYPLNPNVFTKEDFAPSRTFSTKGQLPPDYPNASIEDSNGSDIDDEVNMHPTNEDHGLTIDDGISTSKPISRDIPIDTTLESAFLGAEVKVEQVTMKDLLPPPGLFLHTKSQMHAEIARLRDCLASSIARVDKAEAHAGLMAKQNSDLQKKLNSKKRTGSKKKLTTDSRLITSDEYISVRRKEREEEDRETKRLADKAEQKREEELKRERERVDKAHTLIWSIGWRNKRKDDLKDLCYALGLSMEGTRDSMVKRVETHLTAQPALASDNRFRALFAPKVTEM